MPPSPHHVVATETAQLLRRAAMGIVLVFSLIALGSVAGCPLGEPAVKHSSGSVPEPTGKRLAFEVTGKTQPVPNRRAIIAPAVLHPVIQVLVEPGDQVKRNQVLIKLDADEPHADVRARQAVLAALKASLARLKAQPHEEQRAEFRAAADSAHVSAQHARQRLERMAPYQTAIPEQSYREAQAALTRFEAEERAAMARLQQLLKKPISFEIAELEARIAAAKAALESAQGELEHYTLTAPITGTISWLDVAPGTVSRPGTSVWGEILDLQQIDVRCDVAPEQADMLRVGHETEVRQGRRSDYGWKGRVVGVGIAADRQTGRVPVRVRLTNPHERLRCYVEVKVRFRPEPNTPERRMTLHGKTIIGEATAE